MFHPGLVPLVLTCIPRHIAPSPVPVLAIGCIGLRIIYASLAERLNSSRLHPSGTDTKYNNTMNAVAGSAETHPQSLSDLIGSLGRRCCREGGRVRAGQGVVT